MADSQALTTRTTQPMTRVDARPTERMPAEEQIRVTREQIADTAGRIEQRLRRDLDWKYWVGRYPLQAAGLATAAGFVVGALLGDGGSDRKDEPRDDFDDEGEPKPATRRAIRKTGQTTILATVAANVATNLLREGARVLARRFLDGR